MTEPLGCAATRARIMAAFLALGRSLDLWSLALLMLALAGLLWLPLTPVPAVLLLASLPAGAAQKLFALRVAFDAALLCHWAATWDRRNGEARLDPMALAADLAALDHALASCGLRAPAGGRLRSLDSRLHGARRLFRWQALAFALQFAAMICAVAALHLLAAG